MSQLFCVYIVLKLSFVFKGSNIHF